MLNENFRGVSAVAFATIQGGKNVLLFQFGERGKFFRVRTATDVAEAFNEAGRMLEPVGLMARPRCSGSSMPFSPQRMTARSTTFWSSRTLPGQNGITSMQRGIGETFHVDAVFALQAAHEFGGQQGNILTAVP